MSKKTKQQQIVKDGRLFNVGDIVICVKDSTIVGQPSNTIYEVEYLVPDRVEAVIRNEKGDSFLVKQYIGKLERYKPASIGDIVIAKGKTNGEWHIGKVISQENGQIGLETKTEPRVVNVNVQDFQFSKLKGHENG